jgi:thioredoxin 1
MKRSWIVGIALLMVISVAVVALAAKSKPKSAPKPAALPKIVDLGSTQCIPCKMMVSVLEQLKTEYKGKLLVQFIDVEKDPDARGKYKVRMIPTQILFDCKGKEIARHLGFWAKEDIIAEFRKHGIKL